MSHPTRPAGRIEDGVGMEYMIRKEVHGFTIREDSGRGLIGRMWAYTALDEALSGLHELMSEKPNSDVGSV